MSWRRGQEFKIDNTTRRYTPISTSDKTRYSIDIGIGSFGIVTIPWRGTSRDDAERSFLEFLHNPEFADISEYPTLRTINCVFNGLHVSVRFRTDWVSAYSISPIS